MNRQKKEHSITIEAVQEQASEELFYPMISLVSFVLGICGFFLIIASYVPNRYNNMILFVGLPLLGVGLWYINQKKGKWIHRFYFAVIAASVILFFFNADEILYEAHLLIRQLNHTLFAYEASSAQYTDMTLLMLFLAVLSACLMFFLVFILKAHRIAAGISLLFILLCPMTGNLPSIIGIIFLIIFFTVSSFTVEKTDIKKKKIQSGHNWMAVSRNSAFFSGLLAITFVCAGVWTGLFSDHAYKQVLKLDEFISKTCERLLWADDAQNGFINRGNLYQDSENSQLTVTVTKMPTETLYLKAFQGNIYTGVSWQKDLEEAFYQNVIHSYDEQSDLTVDEFYSFLPFALNTDAKFYDSRWRGCGYDFIVMLEHENFDIRKIEVSGDSSSDYMPYFAHLSKYVDYYDDIFLTYYYYETSELEKDLMKLNSTGDIIDLIDAYVTHATDYLEVPKERIPRLAALCEENPYTGIQDITKFIKSSLNALASYTTTPGMAPVNKDIVEYTFFERGEGYCVHFASAAVLMYRMYGIPARYVSGCAIKPSEFAKQSDGTYIAHPTGVNSHAWVEIYQEGLGWIPVEVTPAYSESNLLSERETPDAQTGAATPSPERPTSAPEPMSSGQQSEHLNNELPNTEVNSGISLKDMFEKIEILFKFLAIPVSGFILALLMRHRRKLLLRRQKRSSVRALFSRMLQLCEQKEMLVGFVGLEEDFVETFSAQFPLVSEKETAELLRIIHNAAYGDIKPEKEEHLYVLHFYQRIADAVYETLNPLQKFWFKWIRVWN